MKKILTLIALLNCMCGFAQHEIGKKVTELVAKQAYFKKYTILNPLAAPVSKEITTVVGKATLALINTNALADITANKTPYIELEIPYDNQTITVLLYQANILAEGFHVDTDKSAQQYYEPGVYYRGIVKGNPESVAAFSFFKNECSGMVSSRQLNNVVIGKLDRINNDSDYIVYSDADMKIGNDFECHTADTVSESHKNNDIATPESSKCVTMYVEMDYNLYVANASNITTTTNWMTAVFNNVKTLYANDGIDVALKSVYVWTTPDPYTGEDSSDYLNQFNEMRPIFDGDVGQLVGIDPNGLGGVARVTNGLCSNNNFSYSDVSYSYNTVPTYSWTVMVITHEFGHLLGSPHTHSCVWNGNNTPIDNCGPYSIGASGEGYSCMTTPPLLPSSVVKGTIMSYCHLINGIGISFSNGFGPQPKARIVTAMNAATCVSSDCIHTCINTIVDINTVTTENSATISWTQLSNTTDWLVSVVPNNSTPVYTAVAGSSYSLSGLLPNTFYKVSIRPDCDAALTTEVTTALMVTDAAYCGLDITDSGGPAGNHGHNEDYIRTLIPNLPGKKIRLTFSSFFLAGRDRLFIYDGNSISAPDLTAGGLVGLFIPGPYESTAADGSLTIRFTSDDVVVRPGFVAHVECTNILGKDNFVPDIDLSYAPNPTNGRVAITSKTAITDLMVYNNLGQVLYHRTSPSENPVVDISAFAAGTYFFKLKFGDREANFKILKNQ